MRRSLSFYRCNSTSVMMIMMMTINVCLTLTHEVGLTLVDLGLESMYLWTNVSSSAGCLCASLIDRWRNVKRSSVCWSWRLTCIFVATLHSIEFLEQHRNHFALDFSWTLRGHFGTVRILSSQRCLVNNWMDTQAAAYAWKLLLCCILSASGLVRAAPEHLH